MNIQNITALTEQLQLLGFGNTSYQLLKRICFKPDQFYLSQKIAKGRDQLVCQLFFVREEKQNLYQLIYYDANLQKEIAISDAIVNGIDVTELDKQMTGIDWQTAFELDEKKQWSEDDKPSWEKEQKIEAIVDNLKALDLAENGKTISESLKLKYWAGISNLELAVNSSPLKNKSEISQRFYFFAGQPGISVDEAHRFLQNRWLEKQIHAKRKLTEEINGDGRNPDGTPSSDNGLLIKKSINNSREVKKSKSKPN